MGRVDCEEIDLTFFFVFFDDRAESSLILFADVERDEEARGVIPTGLDARYVEVDFPKIENFGNNG